MNVARIVGGLRGDTGLTPRGVEQAERLRDRLAATGEIKADVLLASSMPRARQTAEIIAPALGLSPRLDDELHEIRPGEADGLPMDEALERYAVPDLEREPFRPISPGGEGWAHFVFRVFSALDRVTREHAGKTIVIVTHGGFIDNAFLYFFGMSPHAPPPAQFSTRHTSLTHWQRRRRWRGEEGWHLVSYNDAAHLLRSRQDQ